MNDIMKMYQEIEEDPKSHLAEKNLCYLFQYWIGVYVGESQERGYLFHSELAKGIYRQLLKKGYRLDFSYSWDEMLYSITNNNDDAAWKLFFECIYECVRRCGKRQTEKESKNTKSKIRDIKEIFASIEKRPMHTIRRIDYLTHNFAGIYAKEDDTFNSENFAKISQWIYDSLRREGHEVTYSKWWHEMIYEVTTDEEKAWDMLFQMIHEYFDEH